MSDIMYDDPKYRVSVESIAVHNEQFVRGFFGQYRFLSNFWPARVQWGRLVYPSSEHAYQAAKVRDEERERFLHVTAAESKKLWRMIGAELSPSEWNDYRDEVMAEVVFSKFLLNHDLRQKLVETGDRYLEETNWWRDEYWGCNPQGHGENKLGVILMRTRAYWKFVS